MPVHSTPEAIAGASADLAPYLRALLAARWLILAGTLLGAALATVLALRAPSLYLASARVSVVDIEDPGGVSPDDRRAPEVLTLVEHGFVMGTTRDNYNAVMLARLRSRSFTMHFLDSNNVYRHFYPAMWDAQGQAWRSGFTPDRGASFTRFRDEVRSIGVDEETGIVSVSMRWTGPQLPVELANSYVACFNEYMRERTREEVQRKQDFLENKLRQSDLVDIQRSIYRLIEAQTAIMMLVNARKEYVLEIIDPAARPYRSITMGRKKKIAIGAVAGLLLSVFAVFAFTLLCELWLSLRVHLQPAGSTPDTEVKHP